MSIDDANPKGKNKGNDSAAKQPRKKRKRYRSPQRRIAVGLIQFAVVAYAAMVGVLIAMETRLVYPGAYMDEHRVPSGLNASIVPSPAVELHFSNQSIEPRILVVPIKSTDGLTLNGRLCERGTDREVVLYFHGNGISAAALDPWLCELSDLLDANVMAAEYRGFADDATPTERGVLADSLAARDFLCDRYEVAPDEIILYGESLGGGCAVAVASNGGAKALILDRTFDRMIDVAAGMYPFVPVRWVMRNRYDSIARLTVYHGPLIAIHGTADKLIPIENGRRLYDSARCIQKRWIEVDGLEHIGPLPDETMREVAETLHRFTSTDE